MAAGVISAKCGWPITDYALLALYDPLMDYSHLHMLWAGLNSLLFSENKATRNQ